MRDKGGRRTWLRGKWLIETHRNTRVVSRAHTHGVLPPAYIKHEREAGRSKRTLVVPNRIYSKTDRISWGQLSHTYSNTATATILLETKLDNTLMACTSGRSLPTGAVAARLKRKQVDTNEAQ